VRQVNSAKQLFSAFLAKNSLSSGSGKSLTTGSATDTAHHTLLLVVLYGFSAWVFVCDVYQHVSSRYRWCFLAHLWLVYMGADVYRTMCRPHL